MPGAEEISPEWEVGFVTAHLPGPTHSRSQILVAHALG